MIYPTALFRAFPIGKGKGIPGKIKICLLTYLHLDEGRKGEREKLGRTPSTELAFHYNVINRKS